MSVIKVEFEGSKGRLWVEIVITGIIGVGYKFIHWSKVVGTDTVRLQEFSGSNLRNHPREEKLVNKKLLSPPPEEPISEYDGRRLNLTVTAPDNKNKDEYKAHFYVYQEESDGSPYRKYLGGHEKKFSDKVGHTLAIDLKKI